MIEQYKICRFYICIVFYVVNQIKRLQIFYLYYKEAVV